MYDFKDKVALITGGGAGIGRATALAFARAGAKVAIGNRSVEHGEETVELIEAAGGTALFQSTDVTVAAQVEALVARAVREFGAVDCAFNNAGVLAPLRNSDESRGRLRPRDGHEREGRLARDEVRAQADAEARRRRDRQQRVGRGGRRLRPRREHYVASKHAVVGLTKAAALENARLGIRVNVVAPAVIDTDMGASFAGGLKITMEEFGRVHPIGRVGPPEEVANAVLWLCSGDASFVTGHTLALDGGFTAQ